MNTWGWRMKRSAILGLILSMTFAIASCRSFDYGLLDQNAYIDKSIKPMRVIVNMDSLEACFGEGLLQRFQEQNPMNQEGLDKSRQMIKEDKIRITRLFKQNLKSSSESNAAFLSVIIRNHRFDMNMGWMASIAALGALNQLGCPIASGSVSIEVEAAILTPTGKVLKSYTVRATDTEYYAAYWGYSLFDVDSYRVAYTRAILAACMDLRDQLHKDAMSINSLIK